MLVHVLADVVSVDADGEFRRRRVVTDDLRRETFSKEFVYRVFSDLLVTESLD